jgi:hypothetical protein
MTLNHPLWSAPSSADRARALAFIAKGAGATTHTERETAYLHAVATLFGDGSAAGQSARDLAYESEMAGLYATYPDDETALFYALAIEGAPGYHRDPARIERAGALLATVHAHQPDHPGALHYTIHAYDEPGYEERGLAAARAYAASAPAIPHALHMPSHTFLALGLWDESNQTNRRAFAASDASVRAAKEPLSERDFHTLSFLIYGDLQAGDWREARRYASLAQAEYKADVVAYKKMPAEQADDAYDLAELASCLTTYAFETGDYAFSAAVEPTGLAGVWLVSQIEASAFGALARRDLDAAKADRERLERYGRTLPAERVTAKLYVAIAAAEIDAQLAAAHGDAGGTLNWLKSAAELEDQLAKAAPGISQPTHIPPAHEMYGLELLRQRRYADAAGALEAALQLTPKRPFAVAGLARAKAAL